jgi:hypothetical protein
MNMKIVKPSTPEEKRTRTVMDTVELTQKLASSWKIGSFQRPLKVNAKVLEVAEEIREAGGVLPGILTIGVLDGETHVVDGQHRIAAWQSTGMQTGYADVRTHFFESMDDMAKEYVRLNSSLVKMNPDDILRGMESSSEPLRRIRQKCPFVGYDMVRRGGSTSPMLSMSMFIRTWAGTRTESPQSRGAIASLALLDEADTAAAIDFAMLCHEAWRRDPEYFRLWGGLNLMPCAWLYRRTVLARPGSGDKRKGMRLTKDEFRKCLMALSAEPLYLDYLVGRNTGDRDRAPASRCGCRSRPGRTPEIPVSEPR